MLFRNREQLTFSADFGMAALGLQVGDIVALTIDRYGWSAKEFEVVSWTFGANGEAGDLRVTMTLRETSSAAFSWTAEESAITGNNSTLPDPSSGLTVTNLTASGGGRTQGDGTFINSVILNWDDVSNKFVDYYDVEWRPVADSSYAATTTDESGIEISPLIDGIQYIFRVRAVTIAGVRGGWTSVTFTGGGDTTAPGLPTAITANGQFGYIEIKWTNPADSDFSHVEVYENTVDNSATSTLVGISAGSNFIRNNLGLSVTRYYWLKSVDFSGNKSAFTAGVSATTTYLDDADFANGIYSLFTAQGLYAIRDVTSLPGSGAFVGEKIYNRTDGKLYQWTGSAWTLVIADVAAGSITETKIANDAITTPKIAANAVTASEIAAATITGNKIVANTITGGLLATSGIITTSAQIGNALITNAKIEDAAVTTLKIGAFQVTSPSFLSSADVNVPSTVGTETTIIQLTINQTGQPAIVTFVAGTAVFGTGTQFDYNLKFYRNTTLVFTKPVDAQVNISGTQAFSWSQTFNGSVTYKVTATKTAGDAGTAITFLSPAITIVEYKR
jgi:hypothetical protein